MKKYTHFTQDERNELSILLKKGYSIRDIAGALGRSPSSISRELSRNKVKGQYDSAKARHKARVRRKHSKYQGMKIRELPYLEQYIANKLKSDWTPEQIAGRLKLENNGKSVTSFKSMAGTPKIRHRVYPVIT